MKYRLLPRFLTDYGRLSRTERELFQVAVRRLNRAYARRGQGSPVWPRNLRIKRVQGYPGIWEMTWSFSGPDGRATFEFIDIDGEMAIRWRRVGGHAIFAEP